MTSSVIGNLLKYNKYIKLSNADPVNADIYKHKIFLYKTMLQNGGVLQDVLSSDVVLQENAKSVEILMKQSGGFLQRGHF